MKVITEIKKVNNWALTIIEVKNGNAVLVVTDWDSSPVRINILNGELGKFTVDLEEVENAQMRLYISNHRKHLYHLLAIYNYTNYYETIAKDTKVAFYIKKRIEYCTGMLEKNLKGYKKV